jgi:uncharacterized RDD family membrane protein YckC
LPAWRKELNEKVRAVRARRSTTGADITPQSIPTQKEIRRPVNVTMNHGEAAVARRAPAATSSARATITDDNAESELIPGQKTSPKGSSAIVEAALTRVQRASESAYRSSLTRPEPPRSSATQASPTIVIDNQATARALETSTEIEAKQNSNILVPPPRSTRTTEQSLSREAAVAPRVAVTATPERITEPLEEVQTIEVAEEVRRISLPSVDELEPYDYLEREIQRIDRTHNQEFAHDESASLGVHLIIGAVDIITIALSSLPFIAVLQIMNGSIGDRKTQIAAGLILLLVSFFYLAVTQCLVSKTFGMMLTNTRVVDAHTFDVASGQRLLLRTVSYFFALAPAALGFAWILFDRRHRGWHDFISGTRVVRDF